MKPRILIVDDDEAITQQLFWTLSGDHVVVVAKRPKKLLRDSFIVIDDEYSGLHRKGTP